MRLARPPRFMISPASMKNGTAISGKLSAPLMMFCATICEVEDVERMHQRDAADDQREGDRHAERHGAEQREGEDRERHGRLRGIGVIRRAHRFPSPRSGLPRSLAAQHAHEVESRITAAETPNTRPEE